MTPALRNVSVGEGVDVREWPYEALVAVIERGLLADWRPILRSLREEPWGSVARRVEHYLTYTDEDSIRALFGLVLTRARSDRERVERDAVAARVRAAVASSGLTQFELASRIGTSASRLSTYATGKVVPSATMLLRIERASERPRRT
ncbi:MAG TPA: helix-turn-helix transcriptional regulator [Candidatus Nanopelagicales bacterium]